MNLFRLICGSLFGLPFAVIAAATTQPEAIGAGHVVQMIAALALVLALIIGAAWLMRRFSMLPGGATSQMRVVSGVMVGARERVVIVEVRDTWLVLGVTSEQVNVLHNLPRPEDASAAPAALPPFAEWLQKAIAKRKGSE